jgi:hypothetical protein
MKTGAAIMSEAGVNPRIYQNNHISSMTPRNNEVSSGLQMH